MIIDSMKKLFKKITIISKTTIGKIILVILGIALITGLLYLAKACFIAAVVNSKPIYRITVIKSLEKQDGKAILDSLIEKELILKEAKDNNITITEEQINTEINNIKDILTKQDTTLEDALISKNLTMEDLKEQIKVQKAVTAILSEKIQITDAEIQDFFDKNLQYFKDNVSKTVKLDDVKDQVKEQIFQQKMTTEYTTWIEGLKAKAKVLRFVNY